MNGSTFVIRGARVLDGERVCDADNVVVRRGVVAELGRGLLVSDDVQVVDGRPR